MPGLKILSLSKNRENDGQMVDKTTEDKGTGSRMLMPADAF